MLKKDLTYQTMTLKDHYQKIKQKSDWINER